MKNTKCIRVACALTVFAFSCASVTDKPAAALDNPASRGIASTDAETEEKFSTTDDFAKLMKSLKRGAYFANLHAHHFMGLKNPADQNALLTAGPCRVPKAFPEDDGRPCRDNEYKVNSTVIPRSVDANGNPEVTDYFKQACEYGTSKGKLDVLFVTPHTKNNRVGEQSPDTSSKEENVIARANLLKEINPKQAINASYYCGMGQEASSISAGNHINIFGQFKTESVNPKPFFFPTGAFAELYSQTGARIKAGEKIVLQMNHPDVRGDLIVGDLSKYLNPSSKNEKKSAKEKMNDYGLDDFAPVGCKLGKLSGDECTGVEQSAPTADGKRTGTITLQDLKATYSNIRVASGNPFRLIEVISPGAKEDIPADDGEGVAETRGFGPTTNTKEGFFRVQSRKDADSIEEGIYDWIYYLSMGFRLSPTANQDNHYMNYGSATASRTGIIAPNLKESSILAALNERRTFASEDMNARAVIVATADTKQAVMGGVLKTSKSLAQVQIAYQDANAADADAEVRLYYYRDSDNLGFGPGTKTADVFRTVGWTKDPSKRLKAVLPAKDASGRSPNDLIPIKSGKGVAVTVPVEKGTQWIFAEVIQKGDLDKIWTAPIWIERK